MNFIDLKKQYSLIEKEVQDKIQQVLNHGQYILGPELHEFEEQLCNFSKSKYAVTCSNGTDALLLTILSLQLKEGDEVIMPSYTYFATAEMFMLHGIKPIFCDIEKDTFLMDASKIEELITSKTRAIVPVPLFGQPCDMNEINDIAKKHNIYVIEDAAQSFGATYHGKVSGTLAPLATTSFFPAKPLGCYGDGGAVFCQDEERYNHLKKLRFHGEASKNFHDELGINGRMNTLQCAILQVKLDIFPKELKLREQVAQKYHERLNKINALKTPTVKENRTSSWAQYSILLDPKINRDDFVDKIKAEGIPVAVYYPRGIHQQPICKTLGYDKAHLPVTEEVSQHILSLPMHPYLSDENIDDVCKTIEKLI